MWGYGNPSIKTASKFNILWTAESADSSRYCLHNNNNNNNKYHSNMLSVIYKSQFFLNVRILTRVDEKDDKLLRYSWQQVRLYACFAFASNWIKLTASKNNLKYMNIWNQYQSRLNFGWRCVSSCCCQILPESSSLIA